MRQEAKQGSEGADPAAMIFEGGIDRFLFKGTNGRWRGRLGDEDLALYDEARARVLSPDCAHWLEHGSLAG